MRPITGMDRMRRLWSILPPSNRSSRIPSTRFLPCSSADAVLKLGRTTSSYSTVRHEKGCVFDSSICSFPLFRGRPNRNYKVIPSDEKRSHSTTLAAPPSGGIDLSGRYHITVSNIQGDASEIADESSADAVGMGGATVLEVKGPDVDGILASMTVALAVKGCSLVSLHAAKDEDSAQHREEHSHGLHTPPDHTVDGEGEGQPNHSMIHDVFYVVDRTTGRPFRDDQLSDLAMSLLEALRSPMNILGGGGLTPLGGTPTDSSSSVFDEILSTPPPYATPEEQITIIPSGRSSA